MQKFPFHFQADLFYSFDKIYILNYNSQKKLFQIHFFHLYKALQIYVKKLMLFLLYQIAYIFLFVHLLYLHCICEDIDCIYLNLFSGRRRLRPLQLILFIFVFLYFYVFIIYFDNIIVNYLHYVILYDII